MTNREIDALVAEKVMGWWFGKSPTGDIFFLAPELRGQPAMSEVHETDGRGDLGNAPHYSTLVADPHTEFCVLHPNTPCAPKSDFCAECIEEGRDEFNFGRCYVCRDFHDHEQCVGVPCQCPCPGPDERERKRRVAEILGKLTPEEIAILGVQP